MAYLRKYMDNMPIERATFYVCREFERLSLWFYVLSFIIMTTSICPHQTNENMPKTLTVQTFNSFTSRLDVYQCMVVQTSLDDMSKNKLSTSMTHLAIELKLCSVERSSQLHPCQGNCVQSDVLSCIMPGMPPQLVQELNVSTVPMLILYKYDFGAIMKGLTTASESLIGIWQSRMSQLSKRNTQEK